jgi:hypothetical protein
VPRGACIRTTLADASHRARLRIEIGRHRMALRTLVGVSATKRGFALMPRHTREIVVLAQPVADDIGAPRISVRQ